ncbi:hypothetical protein B0H10DRAFT_500531 [Mycena sp. CBHHK59/15]|nr:hypothetical protein B0H10DRAFT_500531 [Mycena sp. CBHHK59/15]
MPPMAKPMTHYSSVEGPNAAVWDTTFDISATVFSTLTVAAQFSALPFLQEVSALALTILNTVRAAKDNKESFRNLANDAAELVSAIICVYNDLARDGQKPSSSLKKHVEDLISLLKVINEFAAKHASNGPVYRMVRRTTDYSKIQLYRGRLRQALDVFGLQSSISIHETVMQILKELREQESAGQRKQDREEEPPPVAVNPFGNLLQGNITGNITMNTIAGNQESHSTYYNTIIRDSYNHSNLA